MLSTAYRLRLEGICKSIAAGTEVSVDDMIWAQKLCKSKHKCKRNVKFKQEDLQQIKTGSCLKVLGYRRLGSKDQHKKGFGGADDIARWFQNDKRSDDWRQRD